MEVLCLQAGAEWKEKGVLNNWMDKLYAISGIIRKELILHGYCFIYITGRDIENRHACKIYIRILLRLPVRVHTIAAAADDQLQK